MKQDIKKTTISNYLFKKANLKSTYLLILNIKQHESNVIVFYLNIWVCEIL